MKTGPVMLILVVILCMSMARTRRPQIDPARLDVTPIYKQHSRRRRLVTAIENTANDASL
jgi:hypothetical protein